MADFQYIDYLLKNLLYFYENRIHCDAIIQLKNGSILVHSVILAALSPKFNNILHLKRKLIRNSNIKLIISLNKWSVNIADILLKYLYTGIMDHSTFYDNKQDLICFSEALGINKNNLFRNFMDDFQNRSKNDDLEKLPKSFNSINNNLPSLHQDDKTSKPILASKEIIDLTIENMAGKKISDKDILSEIANFHQNQLNEANILFPLPLKESNTNQSNPKNLNLMKGNNQLINKFRIRNTAKANNKLNKSISMPKYNFKLSNDTIIKEKKLPMEIITKMNLPEDNESVNISIEEINDNDDIRFNEMVAKDKMTLCGSIKIDNKIATHLNKALKKNNLFLLPIKKLNNTSHLALQNSNLNSKSNYILNTLGKIDQTRNFDSHIMRKKLMEIKKLGLEYKSIKNAQYIKNNSILSPEKIRSIIQKNKANLESGSLVTQNEEQTIEEKKYQLFNEHSYVPLLNDKKILNFKKVTNTFQECVVCNEKFYDHAEFLGHLTVHPLTGDKNQAINCTICSIEFRKLSFFINHFERSEKVKLHTLDQATTGGSISKEKCANEDYEYKCHICSRSFNQKYILMNHLGSHKDKTYVCSLCPSKFRFKGSLCRHLLSMHDVTACKICSALDCKCNKVKKVFKCHICKKSFTRKETLELHILDHLNPTEYKCSICERQYKNIRSMRSHELTHSLVLTCRLCDKTFNSERALEEHYVEHKFAEYPLQCEICNKGFLFLKTLNNHVLRYHPNPMDKCKICNLQLCSKYSYRKHMSRHVINRTKSFKCIVCGKAYYSSEMLNSHKKLHLPLNKRSLKCRFCDTIVYTSLKLLIHEKGHDEANFIYVCKEADCDKKFVRKCDLNKHYKDKHSKPKLPREKKKPKRDFLKRFDKLYPNHFDMVYKLEHSLKTSHEQLSVTNVRGNDK